MSNLLNLPIDKRIQIVEDIWDSIAVDQSALKITDAQKTELDKRLDEFEIDGLPGKNAFEVITELKSKL